MGHIEDRTDIVGTQELPRGIVRCPSTEIKNLSRGGSRPRMTTPRIMGTFETLMESAVDAGLLLFPLHSVRWCAGRFLQLQSQSSSLFLRVHLVAFVRITTTPSAQDGCSAARVTTSWNTLNVARCRIYEQWWCGTSIQYAQQNKNADY